MLGFPHEERCINAPFLLSEIRIYSKKTPIINYTLASLSYYTLSQFGNFVNLWKL